MTRTARKKRLTCFVAHAPHLECCFPILDRVARRGRVEVDLVLNRRMLKTDPELAQAFIETPIKPRIQSRARIELFSYWDMRRADAVLSYGDPTALRKKTRPRDRYLPASGTPSIFVQHGLIQEGVNLDWDRLRADWYSSLILWWDQYDPEISPFISADVRKRVKTVGFIKKNMMPPRDYPADLMQFIGKFEKKILVCTNIPGQSHRFSDDSLRALYQTFDQFCRRHPECLLLLRPHRAKQDTFGKSLDGTLSDAHENVIVMDRYNGPFAYSTIHHSLQLSDMVIGHASSAILDAIYADQPTAMMQNDWPDFAPLPDINDLDSLEQFVASADSVDIRNNAVRRRFGELESNLDKAATLIEGLMIEGAVA